MKREKAERPAVGSMLLTGLFELHLDANIDSLPLPTAPAPTDPFLLRLAL